MKLQKFKGKEAEKRNQRPFHTFVCFSRRKRSIWI
jgi:hypothetical protein